MKVLIWFLFVLLAGFWTGLVALTAQVTEWVLAAMASGQIADLAGAAGEIPLPAWLALWVDAAWLQALQASLVGMVQWFAELLPSAAGLLGWITPLLWVVWGFVMLLMLACAVLAHWLIGRLGVPAALRRAQG
jgi:hypothetical protein